MSSNTQATVAPLPNRYFLFNFFEAPDDVEIFTGHWKSLSSYLTNIDAFRATYLHNSSQPSSAIKYPWINFGVSESMDVPYLGKPDEFWKSRIMEAQKLGFKALPAGFREIGSFHGNPLVTDDYERSGTARFFITAVKVKGDITDAQFEENWKQWSGAEHLHNQLKENSNLVDTHIYKSFKIRMEPYFRCVWRTETKDMEDSAGHELAQSVNNRPNQMDGVETFTGFYKVAIPVKHV